MWEKKMMCGIVRRMKSIKWESNHVDGHKIERSNCIAIFSVYSEILKENYYKRVDPILKWFYGKTSKTFQTAIQIHKETQYKPHSEQYNKPGGLTSPRAWEGIKYVH
jgi:hypothetical protein